MAVVKFGAPGEAVELREMTWGEPSPGQMLIRVRTARAGFPDVMTVAGHFPLLGEPSLGLGEEGGGSARGLRTWPSRCTKVTRCLSAARSRSAATLPRATSRARLEAHAIAKIGLILKVDPRPCQGGHSGQPGHGPISPEQDGVPSSHPTMISVPWQEPGTRSCRQSTGRVWRAHAKCNAVCGLGRVTAAR